MVELPRDIPCDALAAGGSNGQIWGSEKSTQEDNILLWPGNGQIPMSDQKSSPLSAGLRDFGLREMSSLAHMAIKEQTQP